YVTVAAARRDPSGSGDAGDPLSVPGCPAQPARMNPASSDMSATLVILRIPVRRATRGPRFRPLVVTNLEYGSRRCAGRADLGRRAPRVVQEMATSST